MEALYFNNQLLKKIDQQYQTFFPLEKAMLLELVYVQY